MSYLSRICLLCSLLLLLSSEAQVDLVTGTDQPVAQMRAMSSTAHQPVYVKHDQQQKQVSNTLRLLVYGADPWQAVVEKERALLEEYAKEQNKQIEWVMVEQLWQRLTWLHKGMADLVVSSHTALEDNALSQARYTLPWAVITQYIIGRRDTSRIRGLEDLSTRVIAIKQSSPLWSDIKQLADENPTMAVRVIPESYSAKEMLRRTNSGRYDLLIINSLSIDGLLDQYSELEIMYDFAEVQSLVWTVHPDAEGLQDSLNRFLHKKHLQHNAPPVYKFDLPELREKRVLRLITYRSPVNYFLHNGRLKGFEYELIQRFAETNKMRLDVVVAESVDEMRSLLLAGKGDVIAASLPAQTYANDQLLAKSEPYSYTAPVVVGRAGDKALISARDLNSRRIMLAKESPYYGFLQRLNTKYDYELRRDEQQATTEATLFRVAHGMYDLTVIGSHELASQFALHLNLRAHFALSDPLPQAWYVRQENTQLLSALNNFIAKHYRKGMYNVLHARYIENPVPVKGNARLLTEVQSLSPYDDIVYHYADTYDFDWRLIVAQMYQESQFDPEAISYAGAEGLMQLIPDTAELMGISDVNNPEESIRGGVLYLNYLRGKFEEQLQLEDRTWFTLAAYNAGYGRLQRARELAVEMGLDKNKWFDNVEIAMLKLAKPYWLDGEVVRDCRCGQAVVYVRDIKTLYNNYIRLTRSVKAAARSTRTDDASL